MRPYGAGDAPYPNRLRIINQLLRKRYLKSLDVTLDVLLDALLDKTYAQVLRKFWHRRADYDIQN
jgi:hypothetical protein